MTHPLRLGMLASGEGSNFQAILDAIARGSLTAQVNVLISDQPQARAIQRAHAAHVPVVVVETAEFPDRTRMTHAIVRWLEHFGVELVVLAGFMKILGPEILSHFPHRVINIHPSLLPAFPGLHPIRKALTQKCKETGVTVHFVDKGVDTGPIIAQEVVQIDPNDSEQSLAERIHRVEHQLYPRAIQVFAEGRIHLADEGVRILENP